MRWLWTLFLPRAWSQEKRGWTPAYVDAIYAMEGALRRANASDSPTIQRGAWQHDRAVGEHFSSRDAAQAAGQWRALRDAAAALRYPRPTPALRACRLDPLGVVVRVADPVAAALGGGPARRDAFAKRMPATNKRYALKAIALVFCSFEQVLVLDADELAVRDPTFLLQIPGSVTWPDFWASSHSPAFAAAAFGDAATKLFEGTHESGQTVLDKRDAWRALLPYLFMNLQSTLYYYLTTSGSYGEGDKETLPLALEWATRFLDPPPKWTDVAHKVASVADLLVAGGAPNASLDLETWARDALYDLGCSAAFHGYAQDMLDKKRSEKWTLDRRRTYASRLPCKLAIHAESEFGAMTFTHDDRDRDGPIPARPGPGDRHLAPTRDLAVPALPLGDGATRACHAALAEEGAGAHDDGGAARRALLRAIQYAASALDTDQPLRLTLHASDQSKIIRCNRSSLYRFGVGCLVVFAAALAPFTVESGLGDLTADESRRATTDRTNGVMVGVVALLACDYAGELRMRVGGSRDVVSTRLLLRLIALTVLFANAFARTALLTFAPVVLIWTEFPPLRNVVGAWRSHGATFLGVIAVFVSVLLLFAQLGVLLWADCYDSRMYADDDGADDGGELGVEFCVEFDGAFATLARSALTLFVLSTTENAPFVMWPAVDCGRGRRKSHRSVFGGDVDRRAVVFAAIAYFTAYIVVMVYVVVNFMLGSVYDAWHEGHLCPGRSRTAADVAFEVLDPDRRGGQRVSHAQFVLRGYRALRADVVLVAARRERRELKTVATTRAPLARIDSAPLDDDASDAASNAPSLDSDARRDVWRRKWRVAITAIVAAVRMRDADLGAVRRLCRSVSASRPFSYVAHVLCVAYVAALVRACGGGARRVEVAFDDGLVAVAFAGRVVLDPALAGVLEKNEWHVCSTSLKRIAGMAVAARL
ncbi:mannosyltransferase [Aureococcus anophagefferens]|nr:mannosyltransferase [Aureococcus anophagefferens]